MAGLFGLFGRKTKFVDEPDTNGSDAENKEAFFLKADDAKTLGDVEFMRKSKTIRRTFPKTQNGKGAEVIQQVSSMEKKRNGVTPIQFTPSESQAAPEVKTERRQADNSMDMFRKMARDIKK